MTTQVHTGGWWAGEVTVTIRPVRLFPSPEEEDWLTSVTPVSFHWEIRGVLSYCTKGIPSL